MREAVSMTWFSLSVSKTGKKMYWFEAAITCSFEGCDWWKQPGWRWASSQVRWLAVLTYPLGPAAMGLHTESSQLTLTRFLRRMEACLKSHELADQFAIHTNPKFNYRYSRGMYTIVNTGFTWFVGKGNTWQAHQAMNFHPSQMQK